MSHSPESMPSPEEVGEQKITAKEKYKPFLLQGAEEMGLELSFKPDQYLAGEYEVNFKGTESERDRLMKRVEELDPDWGKTMRDFDKEEPLDGK